MIKALPIIVLVILATILITNWLIIPLYKYISKRITKTNKEINKIDKQN